MAERDAEELVAKAEKKLKGGMFGNMFGNKKEDAVELLKDAANKFKQVAQRLEFVCNPPFKSYSASEIEIRRYIGRSRSGARAETPTNDVVRLSLS